MKRSGWKIVFIVAMIVFVASVAALGLIAFSYFQGQQKYGETAEKADFDPSELDGGSALSEVTVDWDALREVNPDTVGWIYIPNTAINYPVVQGEDNDHYLTYDFDGSEGWLAEYGAIFLDCRNDPLWKDAASFVYGHHMNDGSMFADIAGIQDQARFDECRTAYLLTPQGNYRLKSFAFITCPADETIVATKFKSPEDMTDYVRDKVDRSLFTAGDVPEAGDIKQVVAFATCGSDSSVRRVLYTYVEDTSATGLAGSVGVEQAGGDDGGGLDVELSTEG